MKKILGQDKNYDSKIGKRSMEQIVADFKEKLEDNHGSKHPIGGFEINGGKGLTKEAKNVLSDFEKWCDKKNLKVIYNTEAEMDKMQENLQNKLANKNKNK